MQGVDLIGRRAFLVGGGAVLLGGCTVAQAPAPQVAATSSVPPLYREMYGARPDERFAIPAVDLSKVDPRFWRREVADPTEERAGTVVVDTGSYFLYWTLGGGRSMRYGVGLGREGFGWDGTAIIQRKAQWPTWTQDIIDLHSRVPTGTRVVMRPPSQPLAA